MKKLAYRLTKKGSCYLFIGIFWVYKSFAGAQTYIVPEYLIHAGRKEYLQQDIKEHNIPLDVWSNAIMGGTGNYNGMPPFRKGLYGVVPGDLSTISLYGFDQWKKGRENWLMLIHLKPECRKESAVITNYESIIDFTVSEDRFTNWLKQYKNQLSPETIKLCLDSPAGNYWKVGVFYNLDKQSEESRKISEICGGVIQKFLTETDAKIVVDPVNGEHGSSWVIRDRNCIADITGTPDELFKAFFPDSKSEEMPVKLFAGPGEQYDRPPATLLMMASIFGEAPEFIKADWPAILHKYKNSDEGFYFSKENLADFKQTPRELNNPEFPQAGYTLLNNTALCARRKKLPELQKLYKSFTDWYFGRGKLCTKPDINDPICRWGSVPVKTYNNELRPDLENWEHISSVISLVCETTQLCAKTK